MNAGLVVGHHGRHCLVESSEGLRRICHARGKRNEVVVGDRVTWQPSGDEGTIEGIEPRRNLFHRQDAWRTKSFAANLDRVLILIAAEPVFSASQLSRVLAAAEAAHIEALILLNKRDLSEAFDRAWERLAPYRAMGYPVMPFTLRQADDGDLAELSGLLTGRTTLIVGPSGAGKSTLINRLVPGAPAQTGAISQALRSGRHTTSATTWYWIDAARSSALIDSPGFQEFGLQHIDPAGLAACMPDIRAAAATCRFYNCTHMHEPGCGVISAVQSRQAQPAVDPDRYRIYRELHAELSRPAH